MFLFPLIFLASFIASLREVYNGNKQGILTFIIFGLSMYSTAMSVTFLYGLKAIIPFAQFFKEILVLGVLIINILSIRTRPKLHVLDYAIFAFLAYTLLYAILPIGEQSFVQRLIALKSTSFFVVVYFAGRFIDPKSIQINKYFSYVVLLTILAGAVLVFELVVDKQLQSLTGYADYSYYFFNFEPSGNFGLSWTFESEGGYRRFASFFANPLEHAGATLIALSIIAALYTTDDNKLRINNAGMLALGASILSIIFAISRAPLASYFLIIYVYALITKRKLITNTIHAGVGLAIIYIITRLQKSNSGIVEIVINTIDFSNPSSVGHVLEWIQGIIAMVEKPLGLGLGTSGRVAGSLGENIGGENQFIIIGVQVGVLALFIYLYIHIIFIKKGIEWLKHLKGKERKICMAVLLLKIGLSISLLTSEVESSSYISYMNWFLSGLFVSVIMQQNEAEQSLILQPKYNND
jgi:hypothetical protein